MSKSVGVNPEMMDRILRAHCQAELSRAKVWWQGAVSNVVKDFFANSSAFWSQFIAVPTPIIDYNAVAECKRVWDSQEKLFSIETKDRPYLIMPNVFLQTS